MIKPEDYLEIWMEKMKIPSAEKWAKEQAMLFASDYAMHCIVNMPLSNFTANEIDFAYLTGVFNTSGIDGIRCGVEKT